MIKNEESATIPSKASCSQRTIGEISLPMEIALNFLDSECLETLKTQ